ncbi:MAG: biotin--[acetyl-CoA-carboxylase] ligase [Spirochaetota bacterium]
MSNSILYSPDTLTRGNPSLNVTILDTIDSTNTYAKTIAADRNTLILAYEQTAGYGRFQRAWKSGTRTDIMMSLLLVRPTAAPGAMVSLYAGFELLKAMEGYVDKPLAIKYPNDIYIDGKKCAGILVEHIYRGKELERTVIGIGVNVFGDTAPLRIEGITAASLSEYGFFDDVNVLIERFLSGFFGEQSFLTADAPLFIEKLARYHMLYDKRVRVIADGEEFACTAKDITVRGGLMLEKGGVSHEYVDVSIIKIL